MLLAPISSHKTPSSTDGRGWKYIQPNTGVIFRAHALSVLQNQVEDHRFAMAGDSLEMDLRAGWVNRWLHEVVQQNPSAPSHPNPEAEGYEPPHVAIGRQLWAELHAKAEQINDPFQLRDWFWSWTDRIPSYIGCRCKENAVHLLHEIPPDFSPDGFKSWAEKFHNGIRKKLGQRQWPYLD